MTESNRKRSARVPPSASLAALRLDKFALNLVSSSPGSAISNRVAAQLAGEQLDAYVASGVQLWRCSSRLAPDGSVASGKEGVLIARQCQALDCTPLGSAAQAELQSIRLAPTPSPLPLAPPAPALTSSPSSAPGTSSQAAEGSAAALCHMDSQGNGCVLLLPAPSPLPPGAPTSSHPASPPSPGPPPPMASYPLPAPYPAVEAGWVGCDLAQSRHQGGEVVCASALHFPRCLAFYQGPRLLRTCHTLHAPTALTLLPPGAVEGGAGGGGGVGLLACGEEHQLSLWDVRAGEQGGLVQRLPVAPGGCPVYSLAWVPPHPLPAPQLGGEGPESARGAGGGLLALAGADRSVVMLEPRKWRVVHKWAGAAKYTIHYLAVSQAARGWCYVAGLDTECVAGRWDHNTGPLTAGNANSSSGGHGRAVGSKGMQAAAAAEPGVTAEEQGGKPGAGAGVRCTEGAGMLSFRGDSKWFGIALAHSTPTLGSEQAEGAVETLVALTQSGQLNLLQVEGKVRGA